jgi:hypothetical protein
MGEGATETVRRRETVLDKKAERGTKGQREGQKGCSRFLSNGAIQREGQKAEGDKEGRGREDRGRETLLENKSWNEGFCWTTRRVSAGQQEGFLLDNQGRNEAMVVLWVQRPMLVLRNEAMFFGTRLCSSERGYAGSLGLCELESTVHACGDNCIPHTAYQGSCGCRDG